MQENPGLKENWKKHAALFLFSQALSLFGTSLVQYAIMWHITLTTQSGALMTIAIISGFLPAFLLSPFAGVWADRFDRKRLIMLSDSMIAASTLVFAVLFMFGISSLWMLFVLSFVRALGTGVQTPAIGAFLPQFVPEDRLSRVNALNGTIQSVIALVSPMASAVLLAMAPIEAIFFIDVLTAAAAVLVLGLFLHVPAHRKAREKQETGYFTDLRLGLRYIRRHGFVKKYFVFCAVFFFLISPAAFLTPLQVVRSFGSDVWRLSAIEITFSAGMIVGGALMAAWGGFKNRTHTMALSVVAIGLCTFALGAVPVFWIYLVFMILIGIAIPMFSTPSTVLLQEKVEECYLGRVFGIMGMITSAAMPLGMLAFGPLSDAVPIEWLLIGTGITLLIQSAFLLGDKVLLEAGRPAVRRDA